MNDFDSDRPADWNLRVAQLGTLACLLEATAAKPGNVHRGADFDDMTFADFVVAATAIEPALAAAAAGEPLGRCVLAAIRATRGAVGKNVNLGTVLLLVPLAAVPQDEYLPVGIPAVLDRLDAQDAADVYQAIRLAQPGGMGRVEEADLSSTPPPDLLHAMRLAADRDLVARQYAGGFAEVLRYVVPALGEALASGLPLGDAIVHVHLRLMSEYPDSLIARKCGLEIARQAAAMAARALDTGPPGTPGYREAVADLDFWLRADGHRRNPGTSADLMAAGLFAALREGIIDWPLRFYADEV